MRLQAGVSEAEEQGSELGSGCRSPDAAASCPCIPFFHGRVSDPGPVPLPELPSPTIENRPQRTPRDPLLRDERTVV